MAKFLKCYGNKPEDLNDPHKILSNFLGNVKREKEPRWDMRLVLRSLSPDWAFCVGRRQICALQFLFPLQLNRGHLTAIQSEIFTSVNFIFHLKNLLKVWWEKIENKWFASDFWITREFPFSVQTLDNLAASGRITIAKAHHKMKMLLCTSKVLRWEYIRGRSLHWKTQRL